VMFVSTLLLLVTDWRYHLQVVRHRPRVAAAALATGIVLAGPYLHFRFVRHPEMLSEHLGNLDSHWINEIPLHEKLAASVRTYSRGLSPRYWFTEDTEEIVRHRMRGYGYLPLWLSPIQVKVLTITSEADDYAAEVVQALRDAGLRAEADTRNEKISYKVREHSVQKVPVLFAVGQREVDDRQVAIRRLGSKKQSVLPLDDAIAELLEEALSRR